jgi:hypothetical protein
MSRQMFDIHTADIEFMDVFKSDWSFMGWTGQTCAVVHCHQPHQLGGVLWEAWQNIPQRLFKVSASQFHDAFINADEAHERHRWPKPHFFYPPVTDIHFNFGRFVNEMMLKIKEHWTINIVDYIPEIICSLDWRINSRNKLKIFRHCVFIVRQYTIGWTDHLIGETKLHVLLPQCALNGMYCIHRETSRVYTALCFLSSAVE